MNTKQTTTATANERTWLTIIMCAVAVLAYADSSVIGDWVWLVKFFCLPALVVSVYCFGFEEGEAAWEFTTMDDE